MIATVPDEIEAVFARGDLIAAVAQDCNNSEVLMVAWMNREALLLTLTTLRVTYWSRSRNELWEKGSTSGNTQKLCAITYDCDGDAVLLKVDQNGAACHTGERSCFHNGIEIER